MWQGGRRLRKKKQEVETQAQTLSTLGQDQITYRLREVEPSFKEFLASPGMMHLGLVSIKADFGHIKLFPACYF
jgi:hypothetical protein